ncbi:MAG: DUF5915 domain-containing protein, partial [Chloroflexota bacterium]
MISKKRYWGLALPFWVCGNNHLQVIGGREELFQKALSGTEHLESPHRPWVDEITLSCPECGEIAHRIPDVGNPWLDAGIVPYSTLHYNADRAYWAEWFPAEFITESFPGQFRNWFYSMLAMSTVLEDTNPFETVLGYALARDEHGREMHKSWGNLIPFDEAADRSGADVMRWLFCRHNPEANLNFGWATLDEVKRRLLILWNTYSFFVTYANVDGWSPSHAPGAVDRALLDRWILSRLNQTVLQVRDSLDSFDAMNAANAIDRFIEDISTWYVRRSRRRFWKTENDVDKSAAYATLYECLTTLARLLAPFMPFVSEVLYQNLVRGIDQSLPASVHLTDYPYASESQIEEDLLVAMSAAQDVVALGRAARDRANIKIRQPLERMYVRVPMESRRRDIERVQDLILDELNVKVLEFAGSQEEFVEYTVRPNLPELGPRFGKRLPAIRQALEALDPAGVASQVESGKVVRLHMSGETIELLPDEILVSARQREGFAAMSAGGYLVALDTTISRELLHEGHAREVVRQINNWRKDAGFSVEERITIRYQASPDLTSAIAIHTPYIAENTLARSLATGEPNNGGFVGRAEFGDQWLTAELKRSFSEEEA